MMFKDQALTNDRRKIIIINSLSVATIIIMFSGLFFGAFSVMNDITFRILSSDIHGVIFGLLVFYLGIRYYFLVQKLKVEIYKSTSQFSWKNFKKEKAMR